jgi:membrane-bound serine protease (ClpP class)
LTLNGARALELGLVEKNVSSAEDLNDWLSVDGNYRRFEYGVTDTVVYLLNTWFITILLILIGLVALYIEISSPGIGVGGLIAGFCAVLFFWSRFLGGTSGLLEVVLFLSGIAFLLVELFVIPGWGLAGFIGLCLVFVSAIMAGNDFVIPQSESEFSQLLSTVAVVLVASLSFLIVAGQLTRRLGYLPFFNRLVLTPPSAAEITAVDKSDKKAAPVPHPLVSVGDWGIADSLLRPAGRVRFGQRSLDVVSDGNFIEPGRRVRVIQIEGNRIVVEEVTG